MVIAENVHEKSIWCQSEYLGLSNATTWPILHKDVGLEVYNIQLVQEMQPADLPNHHYFSL